VSATTRIESRASSTNGGGVYRLDQRTVEILDRRARWSAYRRARLMIRMLVVADAVGLTAAFTVTHVLFPSDRFIPDRYSGQLEFELFLATLPCWILVARLYGLYSRDADRADYSTTDDVPPIVNMITLGVWLLFAVAHFTGFAHPSVSKLAAFWAVAIVGMLVARACVRVVSHRSIAFVQNAVIVGAGHVGQTVGRKLLQHPEYGINLVGFVDDNPRERRDDLSHLTVLGGRNALPEIVRRFEVERVIVAFTDQEHDSTLHVVRALADRGIQVDIVPRLFEVVGPGAAVHSVEGLPLLSLPPTRLSWLARSAKRGLDLTLALLALVALAPLFAIVALLIKLDSRGPVFFRQLRIGEAERSFRIWKFRTMCHDADERKSEFQHLNMHLAPGGDPRMFKIEDDPRTTRLGRVLRRYAIDELPQLFNVVRGEMSLVGPRPLIPDEHRFVTDWRHKRLALRPGMTGLWQVLGRSGIPFEEMVRLDYVYVSTWSLWNDLRLLARTLPVLLSSRRGF
jgi:exopolysaccharide biosynthesis polyprenyl glycosylphosphotransferase